MAGDDFLKELCKEYHWCEIAPGLQMAWLPDKEKFYVAVHMFPTNIASRRVVAKANQPTLAGAVDECYKTWKHIIDQEKALEAETNG